MTDEKPKPSYGQLLVRKDTPSASVEADDVARQFFAAVIDMMVAAHIKDPHTEKTQFVNVAITHIQTAQMWATKVLTWKEPTQ